MQTFNGIVGDSLVSVNFVGCSSYGKFNWLKLKLTFDGPSRIFSSWPIVEVFECTIERLQFAHSRRLQSSPSKIVAHISLKAKELRDQPDDSVRNYEAMPHVLDP